MIDAVIYVDSFTSLVEYLSVHHRDLLEKDNDNSIAQPPVIGGFARIPAVESGDKVLIYARFREEEAKQWRGTPNTTILAEAEYTGEGTAKKVYDQIFNDPEKLAIYDSVYDRTPYEVDDGQGGTITETPPDWIGIVAGA